MPFHPLAPEEAAALDALVAARRTADRQALIALAAERDLAQIAEARGIVLTAPSLARRSLRERAAVEALFAVPRGDALARLADAADLIAAADAAVDELRPALVAETPGG